MNIFRLLGAIWGIPYQLFTIFQYALILIMSLSTRYSKIRNIDLYIVIGFSAYHILRVVAEVFYQLMAIDAYGEVMIIASLFTGMRIVCISVLFCKLITYHPQKSDLIWLERVFILVLIFSFVVSVLQNPFIFGVKWLQDVGGNITSGNHLGVFRSNGGLGGTVIMYANYLVLTLYFIHFNRMTKVKHYIVICLFISSIILCFSRSVFLIIAILFLVNSFSKKHALPYALSALTVLIIIINLNTFQDYVSDTWAIYDEMRGQSDIGRQAGWMKSIDHASLFFHLVGSEAGRNTGLLTGGMDKLNADGYILAHYYDFGALGTLLLLFLLIRSFLVSFSNISTAIIYGISFVLLLFINSGFDKIYIVTYLYMVLIYLKNRNILNAVA